jgi:hypothetical protein
MTEQKSQSDKFKEAARDLDCNPSEAAFDQTLKKLSEAPPPKDKKPKSEKKKPGQ